MDLIKTQKELTMIGKYVIARTSTAGVFAGILEKEEGQKVVLTDARRLWYWAGAASLSELAMKGPALPKQCKFPVAVNRVNLYEMIEMLETTPSAEKAIREVPIWQA